MPEETKGLESTSEQEAQKATDEAEPSDEELLEQEGDESEEQEETSEPLEESLPEGEMSEEEDLGDETLDDFLDQGTEIKEGTANRVEHLLGIIKDQNARIEKLESDGPKEDSKKPKYTKAQLNKALATAIEEGDSVLLGDIMDYKVDQMREELRTEYRTEQKRISEANAQRSKEWNEVVANYAYLSDLGETQLYKGSHKELNLKNANSLLYRLSVQLYNDPNRSSIYAVPGGQKLAVADALSMILKKRKGKPPTSQESKKLNRRLAKAKRKTALGKGSPGAEKRTPKKAMTPEQRLDDYIEERKKLQASPL